MSESTPEPNADDSAALAQQQLLEDCLELVFESFDQAVADKLVDPVVMLLDCEDAVGAEIASAWLGLEAVRDAVAEQRLNDPTGSATTVFARAFAWEECQREVPAVFDYLAPVFEMPPPGDGFLAIAVTAGGASAFTVPESARDTESQ